MSNFTKYLTESTKVYDYRIKVAGTIADDFANKLETAMDKWDCQSLSSGKTTPIVELPLDFPHLKNEIVTIFDCSTNYPASIHELREYIADYMRMSPSYVVVRKPGEPTEEYQEEIKDKKDESEFIELTVTHASPYFAKEFLDLIIQETNSLVRQRKFEETQDLAIQLHLLFQYLKSTHLKAFFQVQPPMYRIQLLP